MTELVNFLNRAGGGFCGFALAMLIQVSVLIAVLYLIDLLIRKRVRAVIRYCIWMLVFVKLVLPPSLCLPTGIGYWWGPEVGAVSSEVSTEAKPKAIVEEPEITGIGFSEDYLQAAAHVTIQPSEIVVPEVGYGGSDTAAETPVKTEPVRSIAAEPTVAITWQAVVFLVWLVGVLVLSVLLFQRVLFVKSLIAQSDKAGGRLSETLARCCEQVGLRRNIELRLTKNMLSPAACGLFRPVILMPASLLGNLSRGKLRAVLVHELAHIKRGDLWVNFLQTMLQIVYFYNPLLWFANAVVREIREKAVDEMALTKLGDEADSYSTTLIDVAEIAFSRPHFSLRLVGVVESKKALSSRVRHILGRPFPKTAKLGLMGMAAVFLFAAVLLPMAKGVRTDNHKRSKKVPYNKQLSTVENVSLKRIRSDGRSSSLSSGGGKLDYTGGTLQDILAVSTNDKYPIIELANLPDGHYSINVNVDDDKKDCSKKVYDAFSGAFELKVSVRPILVEAYILTCPDRQTLTIRKAHKQSPRGFYKHNPNPVSGTGQITDFVDTVDCIAGVAGYFTRKTVNEQSKHLLRHVVFVNETGLDGYYEGKINWNVTDAEVVMNSLKSMGFTITKEKRIVEAIVIELPATDKSNSEFSITLPNGVTVELLGVCEHPSFGKRWWKPDGGLFADEPNWVVHEKDRTFPHGKEKAFDIIFRSESFDDYDIKFPGQSYGLNVPMGRDRSLRNDLRVMFTKFTQEEKQKTLQMTLTPKSGASDPVIAIFKNISLRPGVKTDVKIEIVSQTDISLAEVQIRQAIEQFWDAIETQNIQAVRNMAPDWYVFTKPGVDPNIVISRIEKEKQNALLKTGFDFARIKDVFVDEENSDALAVTEEGYKGSLYYYLIRHNDAWKIVSIDDYHADWSIKFNLSSCRQKFRKASKAGNTASENTSGRNVSERLTVDPNVSAIDRSILQKITGTWLVNSESSRGSGNVRRFDIRPDGSCTRYEYSKDEDISKATIYADRIISLNNHQLTLLTVGDKTEFSFNLNGDTMIWGDSSSSFVCERDKSYVGTWLSPGNCVIVIDENGFMTIYGIDGDWMETASVVRENGRLLIVGDDGHNRVFVELSGDIMRLNDEHVLSRVKTEPKVLGSWKMTDAAGLGDTKLSAIFLDLNSDSTFTLQSEGADAVEPIKGVYLAERNTISLLGEKVKKLGIKSARYDNGTIRLAIAKGAAILTKDDQATRPEPAEILPLEETLPDDWKELTVPDMDGGDSPAALVLDTGELMAIADDKDRAGFERWLGKVMQDPDRNYLLYEYASNKANLMIGTGSGIFGFITGRSAPAKPVIHVVNKTLPDSFSMTAPDGQVYEFKVLQADSKSCRLRYRAAMGGKKVDARGEAAGAVRPAELVGAVVGADGEGIAGAEVSYATAGVTVYIHDKGRLGEGFGSSRNKCKIVGTSTDGLFDLGDWPEESFTLVVTHKSGWAMVGSDELAENALVKLKPWGRIKGRVAEGRVAEGSKVMLSGFPNSSFSKHRLGYEYEAETDANGEFVIKNLPAGWYEVGYLVRMGQSYSTTSRTPVEVKAGEVTEMTLGGEGRPVVGRFIAPPGYKGKVYFGNSTGHLSVARPAEPRPDNFDDMTAKEQRQWRKQWQETQEYQQWNQSWQNEDWRGYSFKINDNGTFRIEDVIPGRYLFRVELYEQLRESKDPIGEKIGSYYGEIELPAMDVEYSEETFDAGDRVLHMLNVHHVGDDAPEFEVETVAGEKIKLSDLRGKVVLLDFWIADFCRNREKIAAAYEKYKDDGRLVVIGFCLNKSRKKMADYLAKNPTPWYQVHHGRPAWSKDYFEPGLQGGLSVIEDYGEIPTVMVLIGPDGKLLSRRLGLSSDNQLQPLLDETMKALPAVKVDARGEAVGVARPAELVGAVVGADGEGIAGAEVSYATARVTVYIHDEGRLGEGFGSSREKCKIVGTNADGVFDLGDWPGESFTLVVSHESGWAMVGSDELAENALVELEPWGSIKGRVAPGRTKEGSKVTLSGFPNSSFSRHRVDYRYEAEVNEDGEFVIENLPAGWYEVGYWVRMGRGASTTSRTPVEVKASEVREMTVGGEGRPVVGRFVAPQGYKGKVYFGNVMGSLSIARPVEPRPENYDEMTAKEQSQWRRQWEQTKEYEQWHQSWRSENWRQYAFGINDDGTFRIEDVIPGRYSFNVMLWEEFPSGPVEEEIGGYYGEIELPAMDVDYSEEPFDAGDLTLRMRNVHHVGDDAPEFEVETIGGEKIKLSDLRGKVVLLDFWLSHMDRNREKVAAAYEKYKDDGRLVVIGFCGDKIRSEMDDYLAKNPTAWPQVYHGRSVKDGGLSVLEDYGEHLPVLVLIGPDGKLLSRWLELSGAVKLEPLLDKVMKALPAVKVEGGGEAYNKVKSADLVVHAGGASLTTITEGGVTIHAVAEPNMLTFTMEGNIQPDRWMLMTPHPIGQDMTKEQIEQKEALLASSGNFVNPRDFQLRLAGHECTAKIRFMFMGEKDASRRIELNVQLKDEEGNSLVTLNRICSHNFGGKIGRLVSPPGNMEQFEFSQGMEKYIKQIVVTFKEFE